MAVTGISLTGQINGAGANVNYATDNAMFLKVFSGEVLQAFETATVMKPLHMVRTISNGKSAQFPLTGIASASYHTPGEDLLSDGSYISAIKHAEKVITIDDLLTATTFIDKLDEAKNHYDVRSIYSSELGRALAREMDKHLIGVAINTAATFTQADPAPVNSAVTDLPSSTVLENNALGANGADLTTENQAAAFIDMMFEMAANFDEKNVPSEDRYVVVTPQTYYTIVNSPEGKDLINRDYNPDPSNSFVNAQIASVAGFRMIRSNIAPSVYGTTVTNPTATQNSYGGNFSRVKAIAFQKQAFGTVKLLDLAMESEYEIRLQGHLMVAKYAMGHGSLRHECAGLIATAP